MEFCQQRKSTDSPITHMSRIRVVGGEAEVPTYMDDLVVRQTTPEYLTGSLFMFR